MVHRSHERAGQALHGLVGRPLFVALVALSLVSGIAGGLLRVGIAWPPLAGTAWLGQAAVSHAALMICGFLGTVIGIERAVALKLPATFAAPLASGLGALCLLLGQPGAGAWLIVLAALLFSVANVLVVRRQWAAHTVLLLVGALAWLAGSLLHASGQGGAAVLPLWFAFLVLTIAAERLEMTRLMRRRPGAQAALYGVLVALLAGAGGSALSPRGGGVLYGTALVALAVWLGLFDIARRTVRTQDLSRYMAWCLLGGYAWLAVAGLAWVATALGAPLRDVALHALGLGFIFSMIMGHAPVILPAVARIKLQFGGWFYLPLLALHLSLALRLGPGAFDAAGRATGAGLNAASIALFAATVVGAALAWRLRHRD